MIKSLSVKYEKRLVRKLPSLIMGALLFFFLSRYNEVPPIDLSSASALSSIAPNPFSPLARAIATEGCCS